uniref:Uncharacterized protein n=1 Tax=Arundo donax TaxID=35708 RepID=A0A0A9C6T9_ARUDO
MINQTFSPACRADGPYLETALGVAARPMFRAGRPSQRWPLLQLRTAIQKRKLLNLT